MSLLFLVSEIKTGVKLLWLNTSTAEGEMTVELTGTVPGVDKGAQSGHNICGGGGGGAVIEALWGVLAFRDSSGIPSFSETQQIGSNNCQIQLTVKLGRT